MPYVILIVAVLIISLIADFGWGWVIAIGVLFAIGCTLIVYFDSESSKKKRIYRKAEKRFSNSKLVELILQDFENNDWKDLDYRRGGCQVLLDEIVTPIKRYRYSDYGLENLVRSGCEQLAVYIGELYGSEYKVEPINESYAFACNSYSGTVHTSGKVSVYQDYATGEVYKGEKVYSKASVPEPEPKKKW